jgi:hypothetical protein
MAFRMAKRVSPSQLPNSLAVKRYKAFDKFDLEQWASCILVRYFCKTECDSGDLDSARSWLNEILDDPTTGADRRLFAGFLALKPALQRGPITDFKWRDALEIRDLLRDEGHVTYGVSFTPEEIATRQTQRARRNAFRADPPLEAIFRDSFAEAEDALPGTARLLFANLDASDEQLRDAFDRWLAETRRVLGHEVASQPASVPSFSRDSIAIDALHANHVLTYIDLHLWARIEGKEITAATAAWALFGDGGRVNTIRDTVKPKAEALLSDASIRPLIMQAQARVLPKPRSKKPK